MNVRFLCPGCERPGSSLTGQTWRCPGCEHLLTLVEPATVPSENGLTVRSCAVCGNHELYKMKGFPHWLGLTILAVACLAFMTLNAMRLQWWAWAFLIGSAVLDGGLYLLVKDVAVCYRCGAHHQGIGRSGNVPFELTIHERYRQERIHEEAMKGQQGASRSP